MSDTRYARHYKPDPNEDRIISYICRAWDCEAKKIPMHYVLDFAMLRKGKIVGFVEVKKRFNPVNKYPTSIIPFNKIIKANELYALGYQSIFLVEWDDSIGWVDLQQEPIKVTVEGRTDRGRPDDIQPMAHYSIEQFTFMDFQPVD